MINHFATDNNKNPEILIITSYPPRECGIATYSQDLVTALKINSMAFRIKYALLKTILKTTAIRIKQPTSSIQMSRVHSVAWQ